MIILGAGEIVEKKYLFMARRASALFSAASRVSYKLDGALDDHPTPAKECTRRSRREDAYSQSAPKRRPARLRARRPVLGSGSIKVPATVTFCRSFLTVESGNQTVRERYGEGEWAQGDARTVNRAAADVINYPGYP